MADPTDEFEAIEAYFAGLKRRRWAQFGFMMGLITVTLVALFLIPWAPAKIVIATLCPGYAGWQVRELVLARQRQQAWDLAFKSGPGLYGFVVGFAHLQGEGESPLVHKAATFAAQVDMETRIEMQRQHDEGPPWPGTG